MMATLKGDISKNAGLTLVNDLHILPSTSVSIKWFLSLCLIGQNFLRISHLLTLATLYNVLLLNIALSLHSNWLFLETHKLNAYRKKRKGFFFAAHCADIM